MDVKIENGKLFIEIDLHEPIPIEYGKTLVVATTHGNVVTECVVDGKPVVIGLNAYSKKVKSLKLYYGYITFEVANLFSLGPWLHYL